MSELVTDEMAAKYTYTYADLLHTRSALIEALEDCLRHLEFEAGDDDQYAEGARRTARQLLSTIHAEGG